jgi:hypothetical protein
MADGIVDLAVDNEVILLAAGDIDRARRHLDLRGAAAVDAARACLEAAIIRLRPVVADDDLPLTLRRAAERCRAKLSSHLLAAENLEAAGVSRAKVAMLLRRGTEAGELEASALKGA